MDKITLYKDKLVELSDDCIVLKHYYLPFIGSKRVRFDRIKSLTTEAADIKSGQYRIWGTRNLMTWFPMDASRPHRDTIFMMSLTGQRIRIGFTVEDSGAFQRILVQKGLIRQATA